MCGICGIINTEFKEKSVGQVKVMTDALLHRGPDSKGFWISENKQVILGHTRLSIIDLDERSGQPFLSSDNRYSLTYNGEIYNYVELREECIKKGSRFRTQSDTEVLVECYRHWGPACFKKFKGMWAVVIYDKVKNNVCISRDFFGIKPLFYSIVNGSIYFASEIKALLTIDPSFSREDHVTTKLFLDNAMLDRGNWTFYERIKRFPHVSYAVIDLNKSLRDLSFTSYWTPFDKSFSHLFKSEKCVIEGFRDLFTESVNLHCRSDVEIGSCLSGGLDSSSIVATATKKNKLFSTFTTRFPEYPAIDESAGAQSISDKFGTRQFFTEPTSEDFALEFDSILRAQDEPYGSTSIFSQYMVFKKIKEKNIKVILDGQGADEALGGYHSLTGFALNSFLEKGSYMNWLVETVRFSKNHRANYFHLIKSHLSRKIRKEKTAKLDYGDLVRFKDYDTYEERLTNLVSPPVDNIEEYLMYLVFDGNLQQLLRYEDRNSMHFSIESRVPFLEPDLVSFICQMPFHYKFKNGYTKYVLRKAMEGNLPSKIVWQKNKLGFASPEQILMKKVFEIDTTTNGSLAWRELITKKWQAKL
jgi:asparagine synthase (glutamine-hydrolysing)